MTDQNTGADSPETGSGGGMQVDAFEAILSGSPQAEEGDIPEENAVDEAELEAAGEDEDAEIVPEPEVEPEAPTLYTVKVNGEDREVSLDELRSGYSRTSDYTRKTMELATQRKAVEADQVRLQALINDFQNASQNEQAQAEEPEPDWDALYQEDPIEWIRQRELFRDKREARMARQHEQQRLQQQAMEEKHRQLQALHSQQQAVLTEQIPEWADVEVAQAEKARIRNYGKNLGFSEDELARIYDSRAVIALRKAMKYDDLVAKRGKVKATAEGKSLQPGTAQTREPQQLKKGKAFARLKQGGGHLRDAANVFEQLLS